MHSFWLLFAIRFLKNLLGMGGFRVGQMLYFTGSSQTLPSGNRVVHGAHGRAVGRWQGDGPTPLMDPLPESAGLFLRPGNGLVMKFDGNTANVTCCLTELSRTAPPALPGGYQVGEWLYFTGSSRTFSIGNRLVHGAQGEVVGPSTRDTHRSNSLAIKFDGNMSNIECPLTSLSRTAPPPLPGGYHLGEKLYYTSTSKTFSSGARMVHGARGEVAGPSSVFQGNGLTINFDAGKFQCRLANLSRTPPRSLPGGYQVGEKLYFSGSSRVLPSGDRVVHGAQGEVAGPAHARDAHLDKRLMLTFDGTTNVECRLTELSRVAPPPPRDTDRFEALGLGSLGTPDEFCCPITQDVMADPVVASDGHSYERHAVVTSLTSPGNLFSSPSISPALPCI